MAYQKLQVGRAIKVTPDNVYNFPNPSLFKINSNITGGGGVTLVDTSVDFLALGVQIGDMVWEINNNIYTIVAAVVDAHTLTLADAAVTIGHSYSIYTYNHYESAVLYVGSAGPVEVLTVGGDVAYFNNVNSGQFLPVQVLRVLSGTTAADIIALW